VIFYDEKDKVIYSLPKSESGEWNAILSDTVGEKLINIVSCETVTPKEVVVIPKVEEPVAPKEAVVAAPAVIDKNLAQVSHKEISIKSASEEAVRNLINKWLTSWQSGDMKNYRNCYALDFQFRTGMNLDAWVSQRNNVYKKSKNINISINDLHISEKGNSATAEFTQSYISSISKYSGKKKLELRKINNEWKIYREQIYEKRVLK
jgi:ketosteroid isomerase-like protein